MIQKLCFYASHYENGSSEQIKSNKISTFIDQNKNCFERSNLYGHITGSGWIVNETFDSCLLIHHRKLGLWLQPGGHADGESNVFKVALKEAQEETGILDFKAFSEDIFDVDIHSIPARRQEPPHLHFDIRFLFQASSAFPLPQNNAECAALAWVPLDEVMKNPLYSSVQKMALKTPSFCQPFMADLNLKLTH
ncbi:MAG: NUDIX hydrolase [Alphaproteobacteria bacterium]